MTPIASISDFIFSNIFREFLEYDHIMKLKLPWWVFAMAGLFVLLVSLWIFLVAYGLKFFIYRNFISGSHSRNRSTSENSHSCGGRWDVCEGTGDEDNSNYIWIHTRSTTRQSNSGISMRNAKI